MLCGITGTLTKPVILTLSSWSTLRRWPWCFKVFLLLSAITSGHLRSVGWGGVGWGGVGWGGVGWGGVGWGGVGWGGVGWGGVKFLHIERKITSVVHSHPPSHYIRKHAPG